MHNIAMMLFPGVTIQDFIAPFEVFSRVEEFSVHVFAPLAGEIETEGGLKINAPTSIDGVLFCDILFIPGGKGINKIIPDEILMRKIHDLGQRSRMVTSVCTGSLVLAAARLLDGYKATSHWRYTDLLQNCGAIYTEGRVVIDRNRVTGTGVTAGMDFALTLVAKLVSEKKAREITLQLEYDPAPPFRSGHPSVAEAETVETVRLKTQASYDLRKKLLSEIPPTN
jgi:cyclohexyl-isocyanide hydratase